MFIADGRLSDPGSEGAKCTCRSYGACQSLKLLGYKHLAPTELKADGNESSRLVCKAELLPTSKSEFVSDSEVRCVPLALKSQTQSEMWLPITNWKSMVFSQTKGPFPCFPAICFEIKRFLRIAERVRPCGRKALGVRMDLP